MKCEKHPDRDGILTVDLPSIGIKKYECIECRAAWQLSVGHGRAYGTGLGQEAHREAQEAWRYDREIQQGKLNAKVRKYL